MTSKAAQAATAHVLTPQSKDDPNDVKVEEIPMPPVEMWEALDNSKPKPEAAPAVLQDAAAVEGSEQIADLQFVGSAHVKVLPLQYPFMLDGVTISAITVRRLRIGDIDRFIKRARTGSFSTFEIYAEMTRLPVAVLRGLIDEDGDAVTDACFDFLPRSLRPEPEPQES